MLHSPSTPAESAASGAREFRTTHWSVVLAAGDSASPQAALALEKLCQAYWYPLYAYVRRRGHSKHDAQDATQGFFASFLHRHGLRGVAPGRAKFRSFLLAALDNFLADEHDRQQAQKRGGGQKIISFDADDAEERYQLEPATQETPEKLFERRWAMTLLDRALARLKEHYLAERNGELFDQLRGLLVEGGETRPYAEVARRLGMTEEAIKKAAQRLKRRYRDAIRAEIAHTVATASEIDQELRYLISALGS